MAQVKLALARVQNESRARVQCAGEARSFGVFQRSSARQPVLRCRLARWLGGPAALSATRRRLDSLRARLSDLSLRLGEKWASRQELGSPVAVRVVMRALLNSAAPFPRVVPVR